MMEGVSAHNCRSAPAETTAALLIVILISRNVDSHMPSGLLVVSLNVMTPPTSEGSMVYCDVTFDPVKLDADNVPDPETILHIAFVALPPIVPVSGTGDVNKLEGSQITKSGSNETVGCLLIRI